MRVRIHTPQFLLVSNCGSSRRVPRRVVNLPVDVIVNHRHRYRHRLSLHRCKCMSGIIIVIVIIDVLAVTANIDVAVATIRYQRRRGYVCVGDKVVFSSPSWSQLHPWLLSVTLGIVIIER